MKISAAVISEKSGPFQIADLEMEEPRADEMLIRIVASGVCHTDLIIRDQAFPVPLPLVLGHEGSGIVEKVGERVTKVQPGDHVVMSFSACNNCPSCKSGNAAYCYNFFTCNFSGFRPDGSTYYKQGDKSGRDPENHWWWRQLFSGDDGVPQSLSPGSRLTDGTGYLWSDWCCANGDRGEL